MKRHTILEILLLVALCLSGAAALIYEVVWTRALSLVMGSTTYALSTMLASFMAGLALGGYLGGLLADRAKNPAFVFGIVEAGIGIFGLLTFVAIKNLSPLYAWIFYGFHLSFFSFSFAQFLLSFAVMIIPTTLMGATFPLVLKARAKNLDEVGREAGDAYSTNNLGAILGSFAAGFFLIPVFGTAFANLVAASINILVALAIVSFSAGSSRIFLLVFAFLPLGAVFLSTSRETPFTFSLYEASRFQSHSMFKQAYMDDKVLFSKEGVQGLVQVLEDPRTKVRLLANDGKIEGSVQVGSYGVMKGSGDWANQLLLAYLPLEARTGAKTFLNIGLGTGTTARAAATEPGLSVDCLEINPIVLEAVERYFYPEIFRFPSVNFIVADARNYLALSQKRYDIISSEPPYPATQGISYLFSVEFFGLAKSRLNEGGVFAQWLPAYMLPEDGIKTMVRSFGTVFPYTYVWLVTSSNDMILMGSDSPVAGVYDLSERIEKREMAGGIWRNYRLWLRPDDVKRLVEDGGRLNTDDLPILEYVGARGMLG